MGSGRNGQQIARDNTERFRAWVEERDRANDWTDYTRGDKLSRSDIAQECGFAVSVLRQNPAVKAELETLERRLRTLTVLGTAQAENGTQAGLESAEEVRSDRAANRRIQVAKASAEQRVKTLEEQNASLRAEVVQLREQLKKYKIIEDHLAATGRLVQP